MPSTILILEDDQTRIDRFLPVLASLLPHAQILIWNNAHTMIRELAPHLPHAVLISLDHDLYLQPAPADPASEPEDPGDGLDVARHLAQLDPKPTCPIIIHSSNADRAAMMAGELELARLHFKTIAPLGKEWIESHWSQTIRQMLQLKHKKPTHGPSSHPKELNRPSRKMGL